MSATLDFCFLVYLTATRIVLLQLLLHFGNYEPHVDFHKEFLNKLSLTDENKSEKLTCRVLSLRPFRKMGKLTKLLYFVTTSERDTTLYNHTQ